MNGGTSTMLEGLTGTAIITEATNWVNVYDGLLLVVVGLGVGFAVTRFVKSLFF